MLPWKVDIIRQMERQLQKAEKKMMVRVVVEVNGLRAEKMEECPQERAKVAESAADMAHYLAWECMSRHWEEPTRVVPKKWWQVGPRNWWR